MVIICEIERDRSFKILKFLAECVRETSQTAAMRPQRVILLFNVRRGNVAHVRHSRNDSLFNFDHFRPFPRLDTKTSLDTLSNSGFLPDRFDYNL